MVKRFLLLSHAVCAAAIFVAAMLAAPVAHAGTLYISGNQLRAMCTEPARKDACAGYVVAIAESLDGLAIRVPEIGDVGDACVQISPSVSVGQIVAATTGFVARNPKLWDQPGHVIVTLAIEHEFPCTSRPAWTQITTKNTAR
jgi:hypothetical protein